MQRRAVALGCRDDWYTSEKYIAWVKDRQGNPARLQRGSPLGGTETSKPSQSEAIKPHVPDPAKPPAANLDTLETQFRFLRSQYAHGLNA